MDYEAELAAAKLKATEEGQTETFNCFAKYNTTTCFTKFN
jgi:hypothetical protein